MKLIYEAGPNMVEAYRGKKFIGRPYQFFKPLNYARGVVVIDADGKLVWLTLIKEPK